jgi:hypothetical protein
LVEPLHTTLLRNPWAYAPQNTYISEEELSYSPMAAMSAVMVAGYTLLDTYHYLEHQPMFKKVYISFRYLFIYL